MQFPANVAVVGRGRWARVILDTLVRHLPATIQLYSCNDGNADGIKEWIRGVGLDSRIKSATLEAVALRKRPLAFIVTNATRNHAQAARTAIASGHPVLVEKPFTTTEASAVALCELARERSVKLAAAHVFAFARYVTRFAQAVSAAGPVKTMTVRWADPAEETRYGERKSFDLAVPVFADALPHVLSIVATFLPESCFAAHDLTIADGGRSVVVHLKSGETILRAELARSADARKRELDVDKASGSLTLNFSNEPGTIVSGGDTIDGDPRWNVEPRPLATTLLAFLSWAAGGAGDPRLNPALAVRICRTIDQVRELYLAHQRSWLLEASRGAAVGEEAVQYAVREILAMDELAGEAALQAARTALR
jgi:predicted dehydrogenase